MKFMNWVLASSMMASVTWAAPRSTAMRSISRRAIGRMKSGMFSKRFSAAGAQGIPSVAFFESSFRHSKEGGCFLAHGLAKEDDVAVAKAKARKLPKHRK